MQQKDAQKSKKKETQGNTINDTKSAFNGDDDLKNFQIDEEPEKSENQKEDMKQYLSKLNKRIDTLVGALSEAEKQIKLRTDDKFVEKAAKERRTAIINGENPQRQSIAKEFQDKVEQTKTEDMSWDEKWNKNFNSRFLALSKILHFYYILSVFIDSTTIFRLLNLENK